MAGALARFLAVSILLPTIFLGNVGGKGVSGLAGYVMGYYTIWLALVKWFFCPVLGNWKKGRAEISSGIAKGNSKPAALKPKAAAYNSAEMCAEVGFVSSNLSPTR